MVTASTSTAAQSEGTVWLIVSIGMEKAFPAPLVNCNKWRFGPWIRKPWYLLEAEVWASWIGYFVCPYDYLMRRQNIYTEHGKQSVTETDDIVFHFFRPLNPPPGRQLVGSRGAHPDYPYLTSRTWCGAGLKLDNHSNSSRCLVSIASIVNIWDTYDAYTHATAQRQPSKQFLIIFIHALLHNGNKTAFSSLTETPFEFLSLIISRSLHEEQTIVYIFNNGHPPCKGIIIMDKGLGLRSGNGGEWLPI